LRAPENSFASSTVFRALEYYCESVRALENFGAAFALRASIAVASDRFSIFCLNINI